ncbi:hypothetical protein Tco_0128293 [Tanacetum coccineum]
MLSMQNKNDFTSTITKKGRVSNETNFQDVSSNDINKWKSSSSTRFKTPFETPSFKNQWNIKRIFKSPLIPRELFSNETPVSSPRWNSTSLHRLDTTFNWFSKFGSLSRGGMAKSKDSRSVWNSQIFLFDNELGDSGGDDRFMFKEECFIDFEVMEVKSDQETSTWEAKTKKITIEESVEVEKEAKVDNAMDIVVDTKENAKVKREIVVFTKAPDHEYDEPFMRFYTPCEVEGNEAIDAELYMAYFDNYMSEDLLNDLGYVRLDYGEYGRKMVKDIRVGVNGYDVEADFVVYDDVNEREPSIVSGRSFLVTTKSQVDFGLGEMKINITMLRENKDVDALLANILKNMVDVNDASGEQVKMGKTNRLKNYRVNKLTPPIPPKIEEISKPSSTPTQPIFHQLSPQQKKKILEALERKYQELTEKKPIMEVLENYMMYRRKLDEVLMDRARLKNKDHTEEDRDKILENGLPKIFFDPRNFVLSIRVNGTTSLSALGNTGASVSVLPYTLMQ